MIKRTVFLLVAIFGIKKRDKNISSSFYGQKSHRAD